MSTRCILLAVSSVGWIEKIEKPTGSWLSELAASYYAFVDGGFRVIIGSPRGGPAPVDPLSQEDPWLTPEGKRFNSDAVAQRQIKETMALADINSDELSGIYLVGGAATAWDFPVDPNLKRLVTKLYSAGRPVSGVCHGVLGLTSATDSTGLPIIRGRTVTGVSNEEEKITGLDQVVPVLPENRLTELGARYSCAVAWKEHVVRDGNLLTGQNPTSAGPLALEVIKLISA